MTHINTLPLSHPYTDYVDTWPTMANTCAATAAANGNDAKMSWLE